MHFFKIVWWRKIQRKKCTCWHMLACFSMTLACFSMTRFQRRCAEKLFKLYIINFGQSSKGASFPEKNGMKMRIYTVCPSQLQSFTKIFLAVLEELRWQKKVRLTDGRTDWLMDGSNTIYPQQFVAWGIINEWMKKWTIEWMNK